MLLKLFIMFILSMLSVILFFKIIILSLIMKSWESKNVGLPLKLYIKRYYNDFIFFLVHGRYKG